MTACVQRLSAWQLAKYDLEGVIERKILKIFPEIGNKPPG